MPYTPYDAEQRHDRPTVKVVRPRAVSRDPWVVGDLILLIEGVAGQRARIQIGGSTNVMYVSVEHDEATELLDDRPTGGIL